MFFDLMQVLYNNPKFQKTYKAEEQLQVKKEESKKQLPVMTDEYTSPLPADGFGFRTNSREDIIRIKAGISSKNINGNIILSGYDLGKIVRY